MIDNNIGKVAKEVNTILKHIPQVEKNKIAPGVLNFLEKHEDKEYNFTIDFTKDIEDQNIMKGTKKFLIAIYRDYWAKEEEREKIDELLAKNDKVYNIDNMWNKKEKNTVKLQENNMQMIEYKENLFEKLSKFIKECIIIRNKELDIGKSIKLDNGKKYITLLKCNVKNIEYFLVSNINDENDVLIVENPNRNNYVKIIRDYNLIKIALTKMLKRE